MPWICSRFFWCECVCVCEAPCNRAVSLEKVPIIILKLSLQWPFCICSVCCYTQSRKVSGGRGSHAKTTCFHLVLAVCTVGFHHSIAQAHGISCMRLCVTFGICLRWYDLNNNMHCMFELCRANVLPFFPALSAALWNTLLSFTFSQIVAILDLFMQFFDWSLAFLR